MKGGWAVERGERASEVLSAESPRLEARRGVLVTVLHCAVAHQRCPQVLHALRNWPGSGGGTGGRGGADPPIGRVIWRDRTIAVGEPPLRPGVASGAANCGDLGAIRSSTGFPSMIPIARKMALNSGRSITPSPLASAASIISLIRGPRRGPQPASQRAPRI